MRKKVTFGASLFLAACLWLVVVTQGDVAIVDLDTVGAWTTYANGDDVLTLAIEGSYVWAGTRDGGVVRWDSRDGSYVQYLRPQDGVAGNTVYALSIDGQGNKWFGTDRGISRLDADGLTWTTYNRHNAGLPGDQVSAIAIDAAGNKWFGVWKPQGYYSVSKLTSDGVTWAHYPTIKQAVEAEYGSILTTVNTNNLWTVQPPNKVWIIGGYSDWVGAFDGTEWITYRPGADSWPPSEYATISVDSRNRVWVGKVPSTFCELYGCVFSPGGVFVLEGDTWQRLPDVDRAYAIATDGVGNVWINGVIKYNGDTLTLYDSVRDAVANNYDAILSTLDADALWAIGPSGKVWIREGKGLSVFDGAVWTTHRTTGLVNNYVSAIAIDDHNQVWFGTGGWQHTPYRGTEGGVSVFDGTTWRSYDRHNSGLASDLIEDITVDSAGNIWFATSGGGVSKFDGQTWQTYTEEDGLAGDTTTSIASDRDGNVWVSIYNGGGVSRFDGRAWTSYTTASTSRRGVQFGSVVSSPFAYSLLISLSDEAAALDGPSSGYVMLRSDPTLYPVNALEHRDSCESSVAQLYVETPLPGNIAPGTPVYAVEPGLAGDWIRDFAVDEMGRLWAATNRGLSVFDGVRWTTDMVDTASSEMVEVARVRSTSTAGSCTVSVTYHEHSGLRFSGYARFGADPTLYRNLGYNTWDLWIRPVLQQDIPAGAPVYARAGLMGPLSVDAMAIDRDGKKWFGVSRGSPVRHGAGLHSLEDGVWTRYTVNNSGLPDDMFETIAVDDAGRVWIGFKSRVGKGGLGVFDGTTWTTYDVDNSGLVSNDVRAIAFGRDGDVWIGTDRGVSKFSGPTFRVSVTPPFVLIAPGESSITDISLSALYGFTSPVTLTVSDLPDDTAALFTPNPLTPPARATLTITTTTATPLGTYPLTITASGESITHTTTLRLIVVPEVHRAYLPSITRHSGG